MAAESVVIPGISAIAGEGAAAGTATGNQPAWMPPGSLLGGRRLTCCLASSSIMGLAPLQLRASPAPAPRFSFSAARAAPSTPPLVGTPAQRRTRALLQVANAEQAREAATSRNSSGSGGSVAALRPLLQPSSGTRHGRRLSGHPPPEHVESACEQLRHRQQRAGAGQQGLGPEQAPLKSARGAPAGSPLAGLHASEAGLISAMLLAPQYLAR